MATGHSPLAEFRQKTQRPAAHGEHCLGSFDHGVTGWAEGDQRRAARLPVMEDRTVSIEAARHPRQRCWSQARTGSLKPGVMFSGPLAPSGNSADADRAQIYRGRAAAEKARLAANDGTEENGPLSFPIAAHRLARRRRDHFGLWRQNAAREHRGAGTWAIFMPGLDVEFAGSESSVVDDGDLVSGLPGSRQ